MVALNWKSHFLKSFAHWMVWINLEDTVQVILFEQGEGLRGGGGGGRGALASDAGGGEADPGSAGSH